MEASTTAASKAYWISVVANSRLGKADKVIELAEKWRKVDSTKNPLYFIAETYCYLKNDCTAAVKFYEENAKIDSTTNLHRRGIALWKVGKKAEALKLMNKSIGIYKQLDSLGRLRFADYDMAGVYAFMNDRKTAYEILNAWQQRFHWPWGSPFLIKVDPLFDNIRNDEKFKQLVQAALDEKASLKEKIRSLEEKGEL